MSGAQLDSIKSSKRNRRLPKNSKMKRKKLPMLMQEMRMVKIRRQYLMLTKLMSQKTTLSRHQISLSRYSSSIGSWARTLLPPLP